MPRGATAPALAGLLVIVLSGCAGTQLTLAVPAVTIPAESTGGTVCYAKGEVSSSFRVRSATYRAEATYRSHGSIVDLGNEVVVEVYGRSSPPATDCTTVQEPDVLLGGPFTLVLDEPQEIVVADGAAAQDLAELVNGGDYWIGVALEAGFSLGGERSIRFDAGRVTVRF